MDCMSQVFKRMGRLRSELSRGCLSGLNGCREPHYLPGFLLQTWRLQTFVWIQRTGILLDIQWSIHAFCYTFWLWFFWMIVLFYCLNIFLQWNEWLIIIKSSCSPLDLIFLSVNWLCLSPMKHTSVAASKWPVKYCQSAIIWVGLECWYIWFFLFGLDQYWFKGLCFKTCYVYHLSMWCPTGNTVLIVAHASSLEACTRQIQGLTPQTAKDFVQVVRKVRSLVHIFKIIIFSIFLYKYIWDVNID